MAFGLSSIFGKKPDVPDLEKLDPNAVQKSSIQGNLEALPLASDLVSKSNQFSREEIDKMLEAQGMGGLMKQGTKISESMMRGELPLSDIAMSQLGSVAKSFGGGFAGSGSMGSLVARDLGLKEMDVINKGMDSAQSWLRTSAAMYEPSMIGVKSMFLTPEQQYQMENEQNTQQFQHDWMKNQINAMPDPVLRGLLLDLPMNLISAVRGSAPSSSFSGNNYSNLDTVQPGMDFGGFGVQGGMDQPPDFSNFA